MKTDLSPWQQLSTVARRRWPRPAPAGAPPLGFHGRVMSRLARAQTVPLELWWEMSVRALPVATVIVLLCWLILPGTDWEPDLAEVVLEEALP
ncbi:MAG: hypothetical protein N3J91_00840 [Verrucomicrobiae bacterium]|nr:hypothetical protein [Verrucomicrobiae bacterium]